MIMQGGYVTGCCREYGDNTFERIADSGLIMSTHYLETEIPQRIIAAGYEANLI